MVHASVFSGIGGPEVAAAMLGWDNAFHCEINPFGRKVLEYWFPKSESYEDITKTDFTKWHGKIDVLTGGFPCQPFSYAGKRGGQKDDRYLWPEMLRVIDQIRPTWVIGENVAGISTMVEGGALTEMGHEAPLFGESDRLHSYELRQTYTIERICKDFERYGYSVQPMLIPAASVGAPHRRERVFIIAHVNYPNCGEHLRNTGEPAGEEEKERLQKWDKVQKPGESTEVRPESFLDASNAQCQGLERKNNARGKEERRPNIRGNVTGCAWTSDEGLLPQNRWRGFPTVSPFFRGNDGIPFRMDDLSIPRTKWRIESIKAYGNCIVPQLIYQIFVSIEQLENK